MPWLSPWLYRKKITIDETKVDADLTDFPVLVKLTSTNFNFSKALSTGYDIRFTSSDGTTLLKYERERHDATNQVAEYWVKIPSVSGTVNTDFYIYYGNSSASDGADPTNVWDSNFKGVWHLKDYTTSQVNDSTVNANNGTKKGANEPIETNGKIAKAQDFDGTDDRIDTGTTNLPTSYTANQTWEFWIKFDVVNATQGVYTTSNVIDTQSNVGMRIFSDEGALKFGMGWVTDYTIVNPSAGTWYYIALTRTSAGEWKGYSNGINTITQTMTNGWQQIASTIGRMNNGASWYYMNGIIDEFRISNVVRSAAWIKASYNSGNESLVSYGSEETVAGSNLGLLGLLGVQ
uniref:DUF2341 domain-containing protein n=1 Tax=candidate division CPR3 bacterium TaxID=2268181 RepID=A0A7V3N5V3_UNCC3